MNDFLNWWYTDQNQVDYMTFLECSNYDLTIVVIPTIILSFLVIYLYFSISYYARKRAKEYPESTTKSFLKQMMNVFLFCAITGYGYTILSVFINPYKLRVLLLGILVFWTYRFLQSLKKNSYIERIYEGELALKQKMKEYEKLSQRFNDRRTKQHISEEMLRKAPFKVWVGVNDKVRYRKIEQSAKEIVFETEIQPGGTFGIHDHDMYESCYIEQGVLKDRETRKIAFQGEKMDFFPYEAHEPYSDIYTRLKVSFIK